MESRHFFAAIFLVMVIILLGGYSAYSFISQELEFSANPRNYDFNIGNDTSNSMQFYPNLRYQDKEITYRIHNCERKKLQDMKDAFDYIENLTILDFQEVDSGEEIYITCNETTRFVKNMFIAGEGGPTHTVRAGLYNVIFHGEILLISDSTCEKPNIAIHELLHALGFNHSNNPNNIMYPITNCKQTIGEEIPKLIDELYSIESLPDLAIETASAHKHGVYMDINVSIKNIGLNDANESIMNIISKDKIMRQIQVGKMEIGTGRLFTLTSLHLIRLVGDEIVISVDYPGRELDKENNNITLEILS